MKNSTAIIDEIRKERERQVTDEGYLIENDDKYVQHQLIKATIAYCVSATDDRLSAMCWWPWHEGTFKPTTPRRDLIKAAALIVAEIERLDRRDAGVIMLTEFGRALRKLRVDRNERILDMAKKIGRSPAFISAIEHGQKNVPDGFDDLVIEAYGLSVLQAQAIRKAYAHSKTSFRLEPNTDTGRNVASLLAQRINALSPSQLKAINEILEQ